MSDPADWRNSTTEVDTPENEAVATAPLQLVTIVGPDVRTCPLRRGAFVVGRGEDADVHLDATQVSRRHVRLIVDDGILLEDCGSANGTVIRGRRLQEGEAVPLQVGEPVVLGRRATLVVLAAASPAARDAHAAPGEMDRLLQLADQVADSELKILITGETGVGKDVLARRIHEHSSRRGGPFVVVDTAAIAGSVLESELFGYEKGAFTGAAQAKKGLLEAAAGGTLFLDELGELPLALQPKLLRALEANEVLPVGSVRSRPIDVRFLAATHRDLTAEVAAGRFRQDLYYRLAQITLEVPPLRRRLDELEALVRDLASAVQPDPVELAPEVWERLRRHSWPGNVRELRNVVERAVLLSRGGPVVAAHLLDFDRVAAGPQAAAPAGLHDEVRDLEHQRIIEVLEQCAGNQTQAAKALGIARGTLIKRLEEYGIPRPRKR